MADAKIHEKCRCFKCINKEVQMDALIVECEDGYERLTYHCCKYEHTHIPFEIIYNGKFCKNFFPKDFMKMSDEELDAFYEEQERLEREEANKQK